MFGGSSGSLTAVKNRVLVRAGAAAAGLVCFLILDNIYTTGMDPSCKISTPFCPSPGRAGNVGREEFLGRWFWRARISEGHPPHGGGLGGLVSEKGVSGGSAPLLPTVCQSRRWEELLVGAA